MGIIKNIALLMLALILYTGALLPLGVTCWLSRRDSDRFRRNRRLLLILLGVQVASFLPCAIAFLLRQPDAIHAMSLPCLVGLILFVWGMVRLIAEVSRRRKSPEVGAEPGAPVTRHQYGISS